MPTINTQDLTGPALDWAVARAEGLNPRPDVWHSDGLFVGEGDGDLVPFAPSTDPAQGHPIIERDGIATWKNGDAWRAAHPENAENGYYDREIGALDVSFDDGVPGPTALIAGMRCRVLHRLGPTVDVPQELLP